MALYTYGKTNTIVALMQQVLSFLGPKICSKERNFEAGWVDKQVTLNSKQIFQTISFIYLLSCSCNATYFFITIFF